MIDEDLPWLAFHAACLAETGADRIKELEAEVGGLDSGTLRVRASHFRKRIAELRGELDYIERWVDKPGVNRNSAAVARIRGRRGGSGG